MLKFCGGSNSRRRQYNVNPESKGARYGLREGDLVTGINGQSTDSLTNGEVQKLIKKSGDKISLELRSAKRMSQPEGSSSLRGSSGLETSNSPLTTSASTSKISSGHPQSQIQTSPGAEGKEKKSEKKKSEGSFLKKKKSSSSKTTEEKVPEGEKGPCYSGNGFGFVNTISVSVPSNYTLTVAEPTNPQHQHFENVETSATVAFENGNCTLLGEIIAELDDLLENSYFKTIDSPCDTNHEGVWTPGSNSEQSSPQPKQISSSCSKSAPDLPDLESTKSQEGSSEEIVPVWTPPSAPSPSTQKKFRPVNFNVPGSPTSSTPRTISLDRSSSSPQIPTQPQHSAGSEQRVQLQTSNSFSSWNQSQSKEVEKTVSQIQQKSSGVSTGTPRQSETSLGARSESIHQNHSEVTRNEEKEIQNNFSRSQVLSQTPTNQSQPAVQLPRYQSPTVTLLQKAREGQLPKGAHYLLDQQQQHSGKKLPVQRSSSSTGFPSYSSPSSAPLTLDLNPNDSLYEVKRDSVNSTGRKVDLTPKKFEGIGPTTPDGIPIALKSVVKYDQQHQWYRRMYESLHVDRPHKSDYITVKYRRKGVPGRSAGAQFSGNWSEPEGYESDTYAYKYATLDRRKLRDRNSESVEYFSPSVSTPSSIITSPTSVPGIRFTPGKIEDYTPGNSSVAAKEIRRHKPTLQWALGSKDLGYESDTNLIIRKRTEEAADFRSVKSPPPPPLSPAEQKQLYAEIQKGGEVPFQGLRKPAPEKPKDVDEGVMQGPIPPNRNNPQGQSQAPPVKYAESEVNIHYKAPIRLVEKDFIGEEELRKRQEVVMKRFYEEQRHRKFLQEIQDMENRRHTDNFTPSQKSPIPLNRYEDAIDEPPRPKWREKTPEQKLVARALFNFAAQNSRELSFRKGDMLFITRKLDANWFEGEHNAAVGIFPSSYVEIIPSYDGERATPRVASEGQAKVRFNFTAASPAEMSIIKGETLVLTRRVDANWYEGRIGSRRGIFPVSYVHVLKEPGSEHNNIQSYGGVADGLYRKENVNNSYRSSRAGPGGQYNHLTIDTRVEPLSYRAVYNYRPAHEDELELRENDIVHVLEKCDDGWFVGTSNRTGLFGTFPGNYVERMY